MRAVTLLILRRRCCLWSNLYFIHPTPLRDGMIRLASYILYCFSGYSGLCLGHVTAYDDPVGGLTQWGVRRRKKLFFFAFFFGLLDIKYIQDANLFARYLWDQFLRLDKGLLKRSDAWSMLSRWRHLGNITKNDPSEGTKRPLVLDLLLWWKVLQILPLAWKNPWVAKGACGCVLRCRRW